MKAKVVQKEGEEEVPTEVIAQSIVQVSEAMKKLRSTRLTDRAIVLLIRDRTGLAINEIERVLNAASSLANIYLKPAKS